MSNWESNLEKLGPLILVLVFGLGLALFIGATLQTALPAGPGANAINTIISGISTELTTFWPIIVIVIFIAILYVVARESGMLGSTGGRHYK